MALSPKENNMAEGTPRLAVLTEVLFSDEFLVFVRAAVGLILMRLSQIHKNVQEDATVRAKRLRSCFRMRLLVAGNKVPLMEVLLAFSKLIAVRYFYTTLRYLQHDSKCFYVSF